jgi:outer membrane protein TolC
MRAVTHHSPRVWAATTLLFLLLNVAGPARAQAPTAPRPLTLVEALTMAAQHNHSLRVAAFELTVARAQINQAEAFKRGLLTLGASYTRINERPGTAIVIPPIPGVTTTPITITLPAPNPNIYAVGLTYQVPLYSGGRNEAQIALAQANLRGAEATVERTKQQVILDVKQAYYQVLLAQAGIDVGQRMVAAADENLRVARSRVAAGVSPRFDEVQAEVNLANARQVLIRSRNTLALAMHGLNALMAQPLEVQWQPLETLAIVPVRAETGALLRRALEGRPELAELQARIAAAQAAVDLARSGTRPVVAVAGGPGVGNGTTATGGATSISTGWSVTLSATMTLFDGNLTAERIREAQARVDQLRATEAQLRQAVELEVRRAILNYASAAEELISADKTIEQAQEGFRIANVRFAAGVSTNLEVVQAQAALSQAEANRIQALFNVNIARAQLERAAGGTVE